MALCHYACGYFSVFNTFFFSVEAWLHLVHYINTQNYSACSSENPIFFEQHCYIPKKSVIIAPWVAHV